MALNCQQARLRLLALLVASYGLRRALALLDLVERLEAQRARTGSPHALALLALLLPGVPPL